MIAALYPAESHSDRESSYPHYTNVLNFGDIKFPIALKDVKKLKRLNNISINVYGIEREEIISLRLSDDKKKKHANLLYIEDPRENNGSVPFAHVNIGHGSD